jgi:hypothetical protein
MSVRSKVIEAIQQIAKEQHVALPALSDDLSLHETGDFVRAYENVPA